MARYPQRAIVAFPEPPLAAVEVFRVVHDPLATRLAAHVTLVFPFASAATDLQLVAHLRRVCRRWPHLPLTLAGVGAYAARWVHLRVTRGAEALIELHDRLYRGVLSPYLRREFSYEPHVTIGWSEHAAECEPMLDAARAAFAVPLAAVVRELALIGLDASGHVERRAAVPLGA